MNGLNSAAKQLSLKVHCDSFLLETLVLVDTRLTESSARILENNWDNRFWIHSYGITTEGGIGRGISIGILKRSPLNILDKIEVKQGNMILIKFCKDSKIFCLAGIYAPSTGDRPGFFERLFFEMAAIDCDHKLAVGDYNVALNPTLDTLNYSEIRRPNAREKILDKMGEGGFIDIFRQNFPDKKTFSWESTGNDRKARLDYFLIDGSLGRYVNEINYANLFASDHKMVYIEIHFAKFKQGKAHHTSDEELNYKIVREIYNSCMRYVKVPGNINFYESADFGSILAFRNIPLEDLPHLDYNIKKGDLLETIINDVKLICNAHAAMTKRRDKAEITAVKNQILEEESKNNDDHERLDELNRKYESLINDMATKELFKRQGCFKIDGEKPSKFFLNLEKHIVSEKYIPCLREGNTIIKDQAEIESKIREFYADLYGNKDDQLGNVSIEEYIGLEASEKVPRLDDKDKNDLEGEITLDELSAVLEKTKDSSAPGYSGISYTFLKKYWEFFGPLLVLVFKESFRCGRIPRFFSYGVIKLLPKPGKDKMLLGSWRPITLLETCYKLLSGCLASRINSKICKIVDNVQKGFIPGRNIVENVRLMYDTFHYAKENKKGGTALVLDYEKAFDSISHKFFCEVLNFFNFGENFINWIKICLSGFKACTSHAGNYSDSFMVSRGARQGDPLSPPLFALAIEIFSIRIRYDNSIEPFMLGKFALKISLYADDSALFTTQNKESIRGIIRAVLGFQGISGLKIQMLKSIMVNFGVKGEDWSAEFGLKSVESFTYLGNTFTPFLTNMDSVIDDKITDMESIGKKWLYRFESPLGRSVVAKTILYPKVIHIFSVIPMTQSAIKKVEAVLFRFVWGGEKKRFVFCREDSQCKYEDGGMELLNIKASISSYLVSWFRRALREEEGNLWRLHFDELLVKACGLNFISLLRAGTKKWEMAQGKIRNPFWKECFKAFRSIYDAYFRKFPASVVKAPIWNSSHFKQGSFCLNPNLIINRELAGKVTFAYEFLDVKGQIKDKRDMEGQIGVRIPQDIYDVVCSKLENYADLPKDLYPVSYNPHIPIYAEIFSLTSKGCAAWSKLVHKKRTGNIVKMENKMANQFGLQLTEDRWKSAYRYNKGIRYGNNIRWLNMQILRGALATNRFLLKAKKRNSDACSFCGNTSETIEHLFWSCPMVNQFYQQSEANLASLGCGTDFMFNLGSRFFKELLFFGDDRDNIPGEIPYLIDQLKRHVWVCRCRGTVPSWTSFLNSLRKEVKLDQVLIKKHPDMIWLCGLENRLGIG